MMSLHKFDNIQYGGLVGTGYKYMSVNTTGSDVETSKNVYKKEVILTPYKERPPNGGNCVLAIGDDNIKVMLERSETDVFFVEIL